MSDFLSRSFALDPSSLSGDAYFQTLTQEALRCGIINPDHVNSLRLGLSDCLGEKIVYYTKENSSSVRTDAAAQLMDGILYTIGLALKAYRTPEEAAEALKHLSAQELYRAGQKQLRIKLNSARYIHSMIAKTKVKTKNITYNDTVDGGLDGFFKEYRADLEPQEDPITYDYPVFMQMPDLVGIERMLKYSECLYLENLFCSYFAPDAIERLLYRLNHGYEYTVFNIYNEVLIMAIRCIDCGMPPEKLAFPNDEAYLNLPIPSVGSNMLINQLGIKNASLAAYVKNSVPEGSVAYLC